MLLATGGYGMVEVVSDKHVRKVARHDLDALEQLDNEIAVLRQLRLAAVPQVVEVAPDYGSFVMERMPGSVLFDRSLPAGEWLDLVWQLVCTVGLLHDAGWLHCDVKPDNVLWDGRQIGLIDFGNARSCMTTGPLRFGTLDFLPREIRFGIAPSCWSDLFATAVTLLHVDVTDRSCRMVAVRDRLLLVADEKWLPQSADALLDGLMEATQVV